MILGLLTINHTKITTVDKLCEFWQRMFIDSIFIRPKYYVSVNCEVMLSIIYIV